MKGGVAVTGKRELVESFCHRIKGFKSKDNPKSDWHERAQKGQNIAQIDTVRLPLQDVTAVIEECMEDGVPWYDSTRLKTWDTSGRSGRSGVSTANS